MEFLTNQIFGSSYSRNWGIGVNYCWNYGSSKLLLHFIEYCLHQLNSKYAKTAVSSTIQYFKSRCQKKCLLKVWSFLVHPPQNGSPVKFFAKLNGNHLSMASIFKLHECQTFRLTKMHNMCKIWFANNMFSFMKMFGLRLTGRRKGYFWIFAFSFFPNFKWLLSKIL